MGQRQQQGLTSSPVLLLYACCLAACLAVSSGSVQQIAGEAIEGFDPCQSGADSVYGGAYQVVATKPSAASDFMAASDGGQNCQTPVQSCGDITFVEQQCRATPGCQAFNYDGRCGYLKTQAQPRTPRGGWSTYVLQGAAPAPAAAAPSSPVPTTAPAPAAIKAPAAPAPAAPAPSPAPPAIPGQDGRSLPRSLGPSVPGSGG